MSLPAHRRIQHGRTHSAAWDALTYACAVQRSNPTTQRLLDTALDLALATGIGAALALLIVYGV
jgi:hypothetical protein